MALQIAQLRESLPAGVELADERLSRGVHDLVRPDVAVLGEGFAANVAVVGPFAGVSAFVGLEIAELGEALPAVGMGADEWFGAGMGTGVDFEVGFLGEGFGAGRQRARVALSR